MWYLPGTTWLAARKCTPLPARTTFLCVLSVLCGFGKCTICQDNEAIFTSLLHNLPMEIKSSEYGPAFSFRRGFIGKAGLLLPTLKKKNKIKRCVGVINQYTGYKKVDTPPCYTPENKPTASQP